LRDPVTYPEPDEFKPERFLNSDGSLRDDPVLATTFGFGKRICPGRHFVGSTLFIVVASLFSISRRATGLTVTRCVTILRHRYKVDVSYLVNDVEGV